MSRCLVTSPINTPLSSMTGIKFCPSDALKSSSIRVFTPTAFTTVFRSTSARESRSASYIEGNPFFFKCHKRSPSVNVPTYLSSSSRTGTAVYEQFSIFSIVCLNEKLSLTHVTSLFGVKKLKIFIISLPTDIAFSSIIILKQKKFVK